MALERCLVELRFGHFHATSDRMSPYDPLRRVVLVESPIRTYLLAVILVVGGCATPTDTSNTTEELQLTAKPVQSLPPKLVEAEAYYFGENRNYEKAYKLFLEVADPEYPYVYHNLGLMNERGLGVPVDFPAALDWYKKAADLGYVQSFSNLGMMYDDGLGIEEDDQAAIYWYSRGAEHGDASALSNLGSMYELGEGVEKDESKAARLYCAAAEQGAPEALRSCGVMYEHGKGVSQNDEKAVEYYTLASALGHPTAMLNLGYMFDKGRGVEQDWDTAVILYTEAAYGGNATAARNLEYLYGSGTGVSQDTVRSVFWHAIARLIDGESLMSIEISEPLLQLTAQDKIEVTRLINEWLTINSRGTSVEAHETWPLTPAN